jgi:hypothetical protein
MNILSRKISSDLECGVLDAHRPSQKKSPVTNRLHGSEVQKGNLGQKDGF